MESYDSSAPMNLGSGREITIKDLTHLVAEITGFAGQVIWDPSKPDGQPRRCLDVSRAKKEIGWTAGTSLEDGMRNTVKWFETHRDTFTERHFGEAG
jgi:nucleoside-diphosphate-sugar epimerase